MLAFLIISLHNSTNWQTALARNFGAVGLLIPTFYFPVFFLKSRPFHFRAALLIVAFALLIACIRLVFNYEVMYKLFGIIFYDVTIYHVMYIVVTQLIVVCIGLLYFFSIRYYTLRLSMAEDQSKQLAYELAILKNYLHPHFVFNNLNNLLGLAKIRSIQLEPYLKGFSDVMRYFADHFTTEKSLLQDEIAFINSYICLEQIKRPGFKVEFKMEIKHFQRSIPSLILLPLIENAFKHCDYTRPFIEIRLTADHESVKLECRNSMNSEILKNGSGTGINQLRNRLNYLFGSRFVLNLCVNKEIFEATLIFPLYD
jgi:LytS/YehU family sensor histidine kinase